MKKPIFAPGQRRSAPISAIAAAVVVLGVGSIQGQTMSVLSQATDSGFVVADDSGIYVFGSILHKYDSAGNELWVRDFVPPATGDLVLTGAVANASGVYIAGNVSNSPSSASSFVRKYDAAGIELWTRLFGSGSSTTGGPFIAADATSVYVTGYGSSPSGSPFLRKFSIDGTELWTRPGLGGPGGVAVDATGVYLAGTLSLRKYTLDGDDLWAKVIPRGVYGASWAVASDGTGIYVVSDILGGFSLLKYDANGIEVWERQVVSGGDTYSRQVAADDTGVYVLGGMFFLGGKPLAALPGQCRSGSNGDALIRKYDSAGSEIWAREFGGPNATTPAGLALNASGVYVSSQDDAGNFSLAKFDKPAAVVTPSKPRIVPGCVVNAASYVGGGVAPGEIVAIFGSGIGPSQLVPTQQAENGTLATNLAGTRVLFNGIPAPLLYVSDRWSSAIVPFAMAGQPSVDVQVEYKGVRSDVLTIPLLTSRPGVFTVDGSGAGQALIFNQDGSLNSTSNPAQSGSIVTVYATGGGEADPRVGDGQILSDVLPKTSLPVSVAFYDADAGSYVPGNVLYAEGVPGFVAGLLQIRFRLPQTVPSQFLAVTIGSQSEAFQVTMALQ